MGNRGEHSSGGDKGEVADEEPAQAQRGVSVPFLFKRNASPQRRALNLQNWPICIWTSAKQGKWGKFDEPAPEKGDDARRGGKLSQEGYKVTVPCAELSFKPHGTGERKSPASAGTQLQSITGTVPARWAIIK